MGVDARAEVYYGFNYNRGGDMSWEEIDKIVESVATVLDDGELKEEILERYPLLTYPNDFGEITASMYGDSDPTGVGVRLAWCDWDTADRWVDLQAKVTESFEKVREQADDLLTELGVPGDRDIYVQCYMG